LNKIRALTRVWLLRSPYYIRKTQKVFKYSNSKCVAQASPNYTKNRGGCGVRVLKMASWPGKLVARIEGTRYNCF